MSAGRKVFHCAVDETALTTNISEIKRWTTSGAITLIVPLYSKYIDFRDAIPPSRSLIRFSAVFQPLNACMR